MSPKDPKSGGIAQSWLKETNVPWAMRKIILMTRKPNAVVVTHEPHKNFRISFKIPLIGRANIDLQIDNVRRPKTHKLFAKPLGKKAGQPIVVMTGWQDEDGTVHIKSEEGSWKDQTEYQHITWVRTADGGITQTDRQCYADGTTKLTLKARFEPKTGK